MYKTPPYALRRGRPLTGGNSINNNLQNQNLNTTFEGIASPTPNRPNPNNNISNIRSQQNTAERHNNNIQHNSFDMNQISAMIQETVSNSLLSLTNQLPVVVNNIVEDRLRNLNTSTISPNIQNAQTHEENYDYLSNVPSNNLGFSTPMSKWNLKFTGCKGGISINDFIFRVETLKGRQNLSWNHVFSNFHLLLSERADEWFWIFLKRNPNSNWPDLKEALITEFQHKNNDNEILRAMMDLKQTSESFDDFMYKFVHLNEQRECPLSDDKLIDLIKPNLRFSVWQLVFPITTRTLNEFKKCCREAERQLQIRQTFKRTNQIHEVEFSSKEEEIVEEVRKMRGDPIMCWNCDERGHSFHNCEQRSRKLFCYKCGYKNVTVPSCPKCNPSLNGKRNYLNPDQISSL